MAYTASQYPEFAISSAVAGKKFLLYIAFDGKWTLVGGLRDTGLSMSADSIDASSKDAGGWGESIPGMRSWSSSPTMVVKTNNPGDAIIEAWVLDEELQNQRPALLFAFVNSQTKDYYYGFGSVTTYDIESSHDDVMTKSIEIAGKGPITKAANFDANTLPEVTEA